MTPPEGPGQARRWDGLAAVAADHGPSVVTVGMFDGVHRGHRALLDRVAAEAAARGLPAGAVTFDRHPLEVLRPEARPPLLTTLDRKVALLGAAGMDFVLVLAFTEELSQVTAEAFAVEVLMDGVGARAIVVGENFRFGHKAAGDPALLAELGRPRGVDVVAVPLHAGGGEAVSSTRVRRELARGDVRAAAASLGRAYAVEGVVVRGDGRGGRQLGIPTANLDVAGDLAVPANGVYAGHLADEAGPPRPAAISVGVNPQFHTSGLRVEAHVLDFDGDLLGARVWLTFEHRLRDEAAFATVDDLVAQIHQDIRQARRLLRSGPGARVGPRGGSARRHVLNAIPPDHYVLRGGVHPETATIAGVLANRGLLAPHTGEPLSEAMVLGVGGGLGAGYILWEFQEHTRRVLVLGFRNAWQYPARWAEKTCRRLRVPAAVHETGAARKAEAELLAAVGQGVPAIAWVDQQVIGHRHLPASLAGYGGYPLTVYGVDEDAGVAFLDDRNHARLTVPLDTLAAARARIPSYRQRLLVLDAPAAELDRDGLRGAVAEGLAEQVEHLSQPSDSFSLPAFRKWARLLTDRRNAKAWPRVFADRGGLFDACVSIYENVEPVGSWGGNLRALYAEFLDEAAGLLGNDRLRLAAAAYRDLAVRWRALADLALPADREPFAEVRRHTDELARLLARGDAGRQRAAAVAGRLWAARDRWRAEFPAGDADADALLAELAAAVGAVYEAETAALATLGRALQAR